MSFSCFTVGISNMIYDVIIEIYHHIRFNNKIFIINRVNRISVLDKSFYTFGARNIVEK